MSQVDRTRLGVRHLLLLEAIDRWGSATAAADRLGVTPSAVSHRLREAERRLGITLTTRDGSGMRLTEAAVRLSSAADRILDELARAEIDAIRIGRGIGRIVRLGIGTYSFFSWLPDFLHDFQGEQPAIKIDVVGEATHQPLASLREERVDIVLMPGRIDEREVAVIPCFTDELVCVVAPGHPLSGRSIVEAEDLRDQTHITYSTEILPGFEYDGFFRPGGHFPERLMNMAVPEAVAELVAAGQGISILSRWAMEPRLRSGAVVAARLTPAGLPLDWNIIYRKRETTSEHIASSAAMLADWLSRRVGSGFQP